MKISHKKMNFQLAFKGKMIWRTNQYKSYNCTVAVIFLEVSIYCFVRSICYFFFFSSHFTCCESHGQLSCRKFLSLSRDGSFGILFDIIPGRARRRSLGSGGTPDLSGASCSSACVLPAGSGASETTGTLGITHLGRVCFLFLVIPELPLFLLACTVVSLLTCTSCNCDIK